MANITRIKNNQITDSTIEYTKIKPGTLVGSVFNPDITFNSNIVVVGNLSITGSSSTINSTDTYVNDPLIVFNNGYTGTPSYDIGIIANRNLGALPGYGNMNTAFIWSEADDAWIAIATTETGATTGVINNSGWANAKVGNLTSVSSTVNGALHVTGETILDSTLNVTGATTFTTLEVGGLQAVAIGNVTPGTGAFTSLTSGTTFTFNTGTAASLQALAIGNVTPGTGAFTTLSATGATTLNTVTGASFNGVIGNVTAASGAFTTLTASGATTVTNSTASTSTSTGALVVTGGVGIGGAVYAGSAYDNGNRVITGLTSTGSGNLTVGGTAPSLTVELPSSGPGATTWGGTTQLPVLTLDAYGRVSTASNIALNTIAVTELGNTDEITANATVGLTGLSLTATGVTAGNYGDASTIPTIVVDSKGRVTSITTNAASTTFTVAGTNGSTDISAGETITLAGTYGVTVSVGDTYANISTPQDLRTTANPTFNNLTTASVQGVIGNVTPAAGTFTAGTFNTATTGGLQAVAIGNVTPGTGAFTTATTGGLQAVAIGNVTPGTGAFTTLTAQTETVGGLQAVAIGNVTPGTGAFTTGTFDTTTTGGLQATAIGNVTPGTATFTTLTASSWANVTATTESTNSTTGAIVTAGGVGIAKNLNVGGDVVITGNLTVDGDVTTVNTATLDVEDLNITVAKGAASAAAANGAGLTVDGAGATLTYASADDSWNVNKVLNINDTTNATDSVTGALIVDGGAGIAQDLYVGGELHADTASFASINDTPIGNATPSTGAFTTLSAQTTTTGGLQAVAIGNVTPGTATFTTLTSTGTTSLGLTSAIAINNTPIGNATPSTGAFTSVTVGESSIGDGTVNTGTLTAGTGNLTYLNVGGDTTITGTTSMTTATVGGLQAVSIGNVTPGTGAFTTLTTTGTIISGGNVVANSGTASTSNVTGAVVVNGGVGVSGNVNAGTYGTNFHSFGGNVKIGSSTSIASTLLDINPNDDASLPSTSLLHATSRSGLSAKITLDSIGSYSMYLARSSRGTSAAPTATQQSDLLGGFIFRGYGTSGYLIAAPTASTGIYSVASEDFTDEAQGQSILISTTPVGSNVALPAIRVDAGGNVVMMSTDHSHSTSTGALVVKGGVGIVGNIRAGGSIYALGVNDTPIGNFVPSTGSFTNLYVDSIDTASIQAEVIGNVAPGAAYFTTLNASDIVTFSNTTLSTSTSTGAVTIGGGLGVNGSVYATNFDGPIGIANPNFGGFTIGEFSSTLDVLGATTLDTTVAASLQALAIGNVTPGTGAFTTLTASGATTITNSTASTTTSSGALVVTGGVGVGGNLNVGGTATSTSYNTGALTVAGGVGVNGNVYINKGLVVNESQTASADTTVLGKTDTTLLWAHASNSYDQVVIGGSAVSGDLVEGAKLQVNSTDAMLLPIGTSGERPGSNGFTDVEGMFRYNTTLGAIEWYTGALWQTASTMFTIITDEQFNGDGSTTEFELAAETTTSSTIVSINGVVQIPTLAYSITGSGTTLTFTEAPANGDLIDVRRLTTTQTLLGVASQNGKMAYQTDDNGVYIYTGTTGGSSTVTTKWDTAGNEISNRANVTVSSANTATTIVTMDATAYRSGKFVIQATHGTDYQVMEALVIHDGTTASVMPYGIVQTNGNLGVLSATYSSGNVLLQFVASNTSTIVRTKSDFLTI